MILHWMLNSLFVFLILAVTIEGILFALRIKKSRIRYLCRTLPFIKLPFDFLLFTFYGDSLFYNMNPFSCEMQVQALLSIHFTELNGVGRLIVPGYLAAQIPPSWLNLCIYGFALTTAGMTGRKIFQFISSCRYIKRLIYSAQLSKRAVFNEKLSKQLEKLNVSIVISDDVQVPFAANLSSIVFPQELVNVLSQEEYEAVIAHELEHLKWKDPVVKLFFISVCAFFWWIPSRWLLKRLEVDQEHASDGVLIHYGLDTYPLASAMVKTISSTRSTNCPVAAICHLNNSKSAFFGRLDSLLNHKASSENNLKLLVGILLCFLAFISFWMC